MFAPWLELPGTSELLSRLSDAAGTDLATHGTTSDAETIKDTAVAQPLLVAASLVSFRALLARRGSGDATADPATGSAPLGDVTAGHSVGELAAAAVAGVLDDEGAVGLVAHRARHMATAAAAAPSGMAAVLGGDPDEVLAAIEAAGLSPANVNGGGQVVAAGSPEGISALTENPPTRARVIPLQVAGAFHTDYMASAREAFTPVATAWPAQDPTMTLLSNADGAAYATIGAATAPHGAAADVLARLAAQVVAPVRWDLCQATMLELGVTGMIELAPGGVLTGLARRAMKGVETVAVKTPDDLDKALDLASRHAGVPAGPTA
ncbi:ACP S-malonyltransferase [Paraoerskovia sediminicola]|uniref:[acyl-carrier-protein] S-malonyltransferase n=1 Tax=Paraoerskovia sediminicola TaxID=1138587 RepID=A0ABM8G580_9CELL|nr:ACP S-malonyltransferase [Paraoerskovia sediminicola]